jgi:hypothetical protein
VRACFLGLLLVRVPLVVLPGVRTWGWLLGC